MFTDLSNDYRELLLLG